MSDIAPAPDAPPVDTPPVDAPPADAPSPEAAELQGLEALPESWQKQVRDLREEAATRRTALKPYEEVFSPYSESDREILFDLARQLATDPKAGAARMQELAAALLADEDAPPADEPPAPAADEDRPLTKKELEAYLADRQKEAAKSAADKAAEDGVVADAEKLGYTRGTRQYQSLMWEALNNHGGDLTKAHEALKAEERKIIDDWRAGKRQDAEDTPTAGSSGGAPANDKSPKTFAEARASVEERLKARPQ